MSVCVGGWMFVCVCVCTEEVGQDITARDHCTFHCSIKRVIYTEGSDAHKPIARCNCKCLS